MTISLKAIHLVDEGCYLVTRSNNILEVEGIPVETSHFVVSNLSSILSVRQSPRTVARYENENGDNKTCEEFISERNDLLKSSNKINEYPEEFHFSNLDEEFAYRRFVETWKPVLSEPQVIKEPVEVVVTQVKVNSGDPDIISLWNAPGMEAKVHLYKVDRNKVAIEAFKSDCVKSGLNFNLPTHSGLRYATVEGEYMFNDDMNFGSYPFVGTLEQCRVEKERIQTRVNRVIRLHLAKKNHSELVNASQVLEDLYKILQEVSKISPKKGSHDTLFRSISQMRQLIAKIEKSLLEEGG